LELQMEKGLLEQVQPKTLRELLEQLILYEQNTYSTN